MQSINLTHHETNNIYLEIFIDKYIKAFRNFITNKFEIKIKGLASFISNPDLDVYLQTDAVARRIATELMLK